MFVFLGMVLLAFIAGGVADGAGEKEKIDELINKLGQRDFQNVVDALVQIGEPAVEPLICMLQDRNIKTWNVHARAVDVLAKIGSPRAVGAVVESLEDNGLNLYIRGSIATTIAELKPKGAAEVLSRAGLIRY